MSNGSPYFHHGLSDFTRHPTSQLKIERFRGRNLSRSLRCTLDRVNVLGDGPTSGHTGCVNALSWARDGELLLSGGDDTTVRIWAIDAANTAQEYPFICRSVIQTGHRANIFSAQMLPYSSRLATVAGDKQVRVFDIREEGLSGSPSRHETVYSSRQACTRILRCHEDRVKRIVTEDSPDLFLSVGEDGAVRQHDLRRPHDCLREPCPTPLVKVNHELSALALSPLTPYQFIVAGESPYGYLFDRRQAGRVLQEEWGVVPQPLGEGSLTQCVRRFGRTKKATGGRGMVDHITGARMSTYNGHEVLLSYSGDAVYLYSTLDEPANSDSMSSTSSPFLAANPKWMKSEAAEAANVANQVLIDSMEIDDEPTPAPIVEPDASTTSVTNQDGDHVTDDDHEGDDGSEEFTDFSEADENGFQPRVPIVYPRQRYSGARNVATVKDVNFLGPQDEFVTSGSDDGNFFMWYKSNGAIHGIYEGDSSIVNMIEGHPHLPLVAVSGIDTTVKLFAPTNSTSKSSRIGNAAQITEANTRPSRTRIFRYNFATLLAETRLALGRDVGDVECRSQ